MAQAELERLAKQLEEELKASSEEYRAIVSDFMPHKITVSEKQIKAESRKQLRLMLGLPPSASLSSIPKGEVLEKIIKNEAPKMCRILYDIFDPKKFEGNRRVYLASEREGSPTNFTFRLAAKEGTSRNVFGYFRRAKQRAQKGLIDKLDTQLVLMDKMGLKEQQERRNKKGEKYTVTVRSQFLAVGHADATAVATQRSLKAQQIYADWIVEQSAEVQNLMKKQYGELFVTVTKTAGTGDTITTVEAGLESDLGNKSKANTDRQLAGNLEKKLGSLKSLQNAEEIVAIEGSDSALEVVQKKMLNQLHSISKGKGRKANFTQQKINNTSGSAKSKTRKQRLKQPPKFKVNPTILGKGIRGGGGKHKTTGNRPGPSNHQIPQMIGVLNRDLSQVVEKNMVYPRLENRTGRFASSARVTDVLKTPSGFPSIGYTYDKNPYQTFETGYRQGSPDRDPRKIIDMSIREIALQFALGRFYTRRV